jgi:hypothetical protein
MNVILKFAGEDLRAQFEQRLREQQPELLRSYIPAKSLPHAVIENLDSTSAQVVRDTIGDLGTVFDDLQFETFGPR